MAIRRISLRRLVGAIGLSVAAVTALSIPAGYAAFRYAYEVSHLSEHANRSASLVAQYIYIHNTLWQYQRVRLAEIVAPSVPNDPPLRQRIIDAQNRIVLEEGAAPEAPVLMRGAVITLSGEEVGRVEVEASGLPLLGDTGLVALFSLLLSLAMYFAVRVFPLRVLDRTLGALEGARAEVQAANDELSTQNMRFDAALNNMSQGLLMFDREGRFTVSNRRLTEIFRIPQGSAAPGMTVPDLIALAAKFNNVFPQNPEIVWAELESMRKSRLPGNSTINLTDGRSIAVSRQPMADGGWVDTFEDVTERRRVEAKIAYMARHDALTDLPNRMYFYEQIEQLLRELVDGESLAVFSLDLDHFKAVNDTLGHPLGDKLLQTVAERMRSCVRDRDIVARLGGDEFALVQVSIGQPSEVTALATRLIEAVSTPYDLDGHQVMVGISIGIALAPADSTEPDQLMKNADLALYRAKADGGSVYRFFEPQMDARMQARRALELDLRKALVKGEFELFYQPFVNLKSGRVTGAEALIRWNHPTRGIVAPMEFIPLAEETGLIVPLGEWVLRRACAEAVNWPDDIMIAVNLSPAQFKSRNLVQAVVEALAVSGLAPGRLELEITELVLLRESEGAFAVLHRLRDLGVRIAMDDFGTGYSSLGYLRSFPFDKIKIDESFIRDLATKDESLAIVRAVVGLSSSLGITTTAEGVETNAQLERLRTEGCNEFQGFLFSQPQPAGEVRQLLSEISPRKLAVVA
jgi:diguanylate cyclase (GGDEF)-like protein